MVFKSKRMKDAETYKKEWKNVSENVFNEKFSKYLRKLTKCKEAGGDLQKRNKNVNVTFFNQSFRKVFENLPIHSGTGNLQKQNLPEFRIYQKSGFVYKPASPTKKNKRNVTIS